MDYWQPGGLYREARLRLVQVAAELHDGERPLAGVQVPVTITQPGQVTVTATLGGLDHVELWDTDHPKLYRDVTRLYEGGEQDDEHAVRIGFREARFALDGFYLNGRRLKLFGADRHQFFPFAGGAMPGRRRLRRARLGNALVPVRGLAAHPA